jgi:hypothetical protein
MSPFLSFFGLLFALFFGVGGGASDETGWTNYVPLAEPPVGAEGGPPPRPAEPPPIVLESRAGRQPGVLVRYSVETDSGGYGGETASTRPAKVTVARPGEDVAISMVGVEPTQRLVIVRRLGCDQPAVASVVLGADTERWSVPRRPGAYELEVTVPYFKPKRGGTGSATGVFGLLVDATREQAVIRASRGLFVCAPGP